jgi:hypothetical protein
VSSKWAAGSGELNGGPRLVTLFDYTEVGQGVDRPVATKPQILQRNLAVLEAMDAKPFVQRFARVATIATKWRNRLSHRDLSCYNGVSGPGKNCQKKRKNVKN